MLEPAHAVPSNLPVATSVSRKKRNTACERCNKRRVKCDASTRGIPCSECNKVRSRDCKLVQSRRTRGPKGRYTQFEQRERSAATHEQIRDPSVDVSIDPVTPGSDHHQQLENGAQMHRTAQQPEAPLDLTRLISLDRHASPGVSDVDRAVESEDGDHMLPERMAAQEDSGRANFVGESWYASYIISTSAASHSELHQTVERGSGQATKSKNSRYQASTWQPRPTDLPTQHLTERLLEAYFTRFHIFCPILDRSIFLAAVKNGSISITLLRCVLFVASIHCDAEIFHLMGYSTRFDASDDLFSKACVAFDNDTKVDRTTLIVSSYLLHYWFGKPTSYRDSLWWLASAIRSAQCMGYHRSTKDSKMPSREKAYFKVLWWCLYIRDRQISLSAGAPMVINDLDHDVEELKPDDFLDESPETANYMIAQATLNQTASTLYFRYCSPSIQQGSITHASASAEIQEAFELWYADSKLGARPASDTKDRLMLILKVCYHFYTINLQQRLQRIHHSMHHDDSYTIFRNVRNAAESITGLIEDSLLYWQPEHFPLIFVTAIFSAMTTAVADYGTHQPEQLSLKLRPSLLALKQFETCHITARWIRTLFMDVLQRLERRSSKRSRRYRQSSKRRQDGTQADEPGTRPETFERQNILPAETNTVPNLHNRRNFVNQSAFPVSAETPSLSSHSFDSPNSYLHDSSVASGTALNHASSTGLMNTSFVDDLFTQPNSMYGWSGFDNFPSPSTLQFQSLYFLADLGMSNFESNTDL